MKIMAWVVAASILTGGMVLAPVAAEAGFVLCKHHKCVYVKTGPRRVITQDRYINRYEPTRYINRVEPQGGRYINRYDPQPGNRYINRYEPQGGRYINRVEPQGGRYINRYDPQQQQRSGRYINVYN